jgi:enamine deaminase RidA (YjgF/YER057c/UK114 family)
VTRQVISSGGPFEQIYGYSRAVRVDAQVHVAGTAARGEALAGDAYVQAQNILATIRAALEQAGARIEDVVRTVIYMPTWWGGHTARCSATCAPPARWCRSAL